MGYHSARVENELVAIFAERAAKQPEFELPSAPCDGPALARSFRTLGLSQSRLTVTKKLGVPVKQTGWWFPLRGRTNDAAAGYSRTGWTGLLVGGKGQLWETFTDSDTTPDQALVRALPSAHRLSSDDLELVRRCIVHRLGAAEPGLPTGAVPVQKFTFQPR